jgi:PAS domain S-box-containing protein
MALSREEIAGLQAVFRTDATAAAFVEAQARLLVLADEGRRVVHAGEEAGELAQAITSADGVVDPANPAAERLRLLAKSLAPRRGGRLEHLLFDISGATTALCRSVTLPGGQSLLVCALTGPIIAPRASGEVSDPDEPLLPFDAQPPEKENAAPPEEPTPEEPTPEESAAEEPTAEDRSSSEPAAWDTPEQEASAELTAVEDGGYGSPAAMNDADERLARLREKGVLRFIWQADPSTRFTHVTDALADVVGPEAADIVGRTWAEITADRVGDPSGIISDVLSRQETWSGRTVSWRIDDALVVPVDLAGMPVLDGARRLLGYRGFGLIRAEAAIIDPRPLPTPAAAEEPAAEPVEEADGAVEAMALPVSELAETHPAEDATVPQSPFEAAVEYTPDALVESSDEDGAFEEAGVEELEAELAEDLAPSPAPEAEPVGIVEDGLAFKDMASIAIEDAVLPAESLGEEGVAEPQAESESEPEVESRLERQPEREPEAIEVPPASPPQGMTPPQADNDAPVNGVFALSGMVRARFGEATPPPLRAVEPAVERSLATPAPASAARPATSGIPRLTMSERTAFREIAKALGARFEEDDAPLQETPDTSGVAAPAMEAPAQPQEANEIADAAPTPAPEPHDTDFARIIERLPVGVVIHRGDDLLLVNRALREMTGYDTMADLAEEGGLARIVHGRAGAMARAEIDVAGPMSLGTRRGESIPVEIRLTTVDWGDVPASLMLIRRMPEADAGLRLRSLELDLRSRDSRLRELSAILDTATDGVIVVDDVGRILSLNRSAEALFGYDQNEVTGEAVTILLSPESHAVALDYLDGLRSNGVASLLNDGREVVGRVRQGGAIPLFMTMGQITEGPNPKYCAVLRDITAFKKAEGELLAAKRAAEEASAQKSDFLAKISHEIRTPLAAIIGFAEVMLEERFGAVGSERYRDYLRDIHGSGEHVISLVNDLLDLAKVEAGRMELSFTGVALNDLVSNCVALLQPQASRERIVMRTGFAAKLPPVVADERSLRQIVLNLVSNAIKFTDAGGQVIVSTAMTDRGEVAFRVRDTGIGMSGQEIEAALEPFRQLATARKGGGTGLGLPLTKALVEANRGALQISSNKGEGTLVEVLFPPTRVLAE